MGKPGKRLIRGGTAGCTEKSDFRRADCLLDELCPPKPAPRGSDWVWDSPLRQAIIDDDAGKLQPLLARGANPNEIDLKWRTHLDFALQLKKENAIRVLREHGGKTFDEVLAWRLN